MPLSYRCRGRPRICQATCVPYKFLFDPPNTFDILLMILRKKARAALATSFPSLLVPSFLRAFC
jgi:hypothetical protein